jgi:mannosyltransferase
MRLANEHGIDATLCFVGATRSEYFEVDETIAEGMRRDAEASGRAARLVFTGAVGDVDRYFRLADVFVLPSRREGLPVALMEAMACALPCVASRLPGATDGLIADGSSGMLVPVGDDRAFAEAMAALLKDRARAAALGAAARQIILERYAHDAIAAQWLGVYDDLTRRNR